MSWRSECGRGIGSRHSRPEIERRIDEYTAKPDTADVFSPLVPGAAEKTARYASLDGKAA